MFGRPGGRSPNVFSQFDADKQTRLRDEFASCRTQRDVLDAYNRECVWMRVFVCVCVCGGGGGGEYMCGAKSNNILYVLLMIHTNN